MINVIDDTPGIASLTIGVPIRIVQRGDEYDYAILFVQSEDGSASVSEHWTFICVYYRYRVGSAAEPT